MKSKRRLFLIAILLLLFSPPYWNKSRCWNEKISRRKMTSFRRSTFAANLKTKRWLIKQTKTYDRLYLSPFPSSLGHCCFHWDEQLFGWAGCGIASTSCQEYEGHEVYVNPSEGEMSIWTFPATSPILKNLMCTNGYTRLWHEPDKSCS